MFAYADEAEKSPLRVNLFDPGAVRTGIRAEAMPGEDPETVTPPDSVAAEIVPLLEVSETRNGERIVVSSRA